MRSAGTCPAGNYTLILGPKIGGCSPMVGPSTSLHQAGVPALVSIQTTLLSYTAHKKSGHDLGVLRGCIKLISCTGASCNLSTFCPSITNQCLLPSAPKNYCSFLPRAASFQDHAINPHYYTIYCSTTFTTVGVTISRSEYTKNCLFSSSYWVHPEAHTVWTYTQGLVSQNVPLDGNLMPRTFKLQPW